MPSKEKPTGIEALAVQADALENVETPTTDPGDAAENIEPPAPTNAEIIGGGLQMLRDVLSMMLDLKTPAATLADERCKHLGMLWGAVADKRGYDLTAMMGDYAAEVAAVVGTVIIGKAVFNGARAELAAREPVDVQEKTAQATGASVAE